MIENQERMAFHFLKIMPRAASEVNVFGRERAVFSKGKPFK